MVRPDNYNHLFSFEPIFNNKITIASVLAACARLGAFDHGIWVHGYLWRSGLESDLVIVRMCGQSFENLQWLSGLSSLQNLDMSRVDLSKASDWFQVTNTFPSSMLVELHMSGCELNQIPVGVANMTRLEVLNLRWNIIWGTIPQWLYTCSNLESLSLYLNLLRGEISSSTGNLTAIVNLDLSANQLEGKIPSSLGNLCKLTVLDLSRNYFNGSVSEILASL
ncbi:unnamed protein product [Prunus brigantina]